MLPNCDYTLIAEFSIFKKAFLDNVHNIPGGNYMFKVNNRNTRTRCEICSKLTIKTAERRLAPFC